MKSTTYRALSCQHPLCLSLRANKTCQCIKGQCICNLRYGIEGALNKLHLSFISQVRNKVGGRYSYCLRDGDSYLRFGNDIPRVGKDVITTNILYPHRSSMFVELIDISVAHKRLGLSPDLFSYKQGGLGTDTGAQFTVIKKQAYDKVIEAFVYYYSGKKNEKGPKSPYQNSLPHSSLGNIPPYHYTRNNHGTSPKAHPMALPRLAFLPKVSKGTIDTFQLPGSAKSESDIVFGCTNKQPLNLSGILGLDRSPVSLLGQLRREIGGQFSYCLNNGDSYLTLGKDSSFDERKEIKTTPLIHTAYSTLFLNLTDISVAGKRLGLYPSLFELKNGGVFMDTGIQYTVLPRKAYDKVSKALQSYFKGKLERTARTFLNLKPCYKLTPGFKDYPTMSFHFQGADYEAEYVQVVDESTNMTCTALFPGRRTVIGALQQWNTKFMFDINQNVLKFYKDDCAP
ncbi:hypothetical protein BUALT_Bualt18G0041000 [Buddleja alternifolia]|uniref:Peptidase A1 domain-containing protein n=1 Tax=Buddleja alternifolia TaxID=168488 RepID=A0AAV6WAB9_9LAMI|nr:hypothetical protein BUALT_Bualt18G0041000 [Buddleja alternifolia]